MWLARAEGERRANRLTALHVEVGRALLRRLNVDGRCDPTHATLAADAGCGERTVRRALAALRGVGALAWEQRLVCRPWALGGQGATRAEQTSNAYALLLPGVPVAPREARRVRPAQLRFNCAGQADRETPLKIIYRQLPPLSDAERQRLEAIQAARRERREAEWMAQRAERWRSKI